MSGAPRCVHTDTVPVDVRDHTTGATRTVARLCRTCLAQLHPGWGCPACEWDHHGARQLCDPVNRTTHVLAHPCKEHA